MILEKLGTEYGSWSIPTGILNENSIVYSFGVGEDLSFDVEILNKYNPQLYLFDPTPRACVFYNKLYNNSLKNENYYDDSHKFKYNLTEKTFSKTKYYEFGLSDSIKKINMYLPVNKNYVSLSEFKNGKSEERIELELRDLKTIMDENNHIYLDILKMDIEGSEFGVIDFIIDNDIDIKYLIIEFHDVGKNIQSYIQKLMTKYNISYTKQNDIGFIKK